MKLLKSVKKLHLFILIAIASIGITLVQSCIPKPLPIKLDQAPTRLAISSQLIPGQAVFITVSKSFSALQNTDSTNLLSQFLVEHARVELWVDGSPVMLKKVAPGVYGNFIGPNNPNAQFELKVYDTTTGLSISSSTRYLPSVNIDSIWFTNVILSTDTLFTAHVQFADRPETNYYMINTYRNYDFINNFSATDALFEGRNGVRTRPVTDALFTATKHVESINLTGYNAGDTCSITLSNISQDYYTYLVERNRARQNGLGTILGEPVTYTTNIVGGYGFFTATIPTVRQRIIPK